MPTVFNEGRHTGEGLLSELPGSQSREVITVASGAGIIAPGSVLGRVSADGKFVLSPQTGSTGAETAVAIALYGCDATSGDQKITAIVRGAEWNGNTLTYHASVATAPNRAAKAAQLAAAGIIVRN
jgi:hypothetical protein